MRYQLVSGSALVVGAVLLGGILAWSEPAASPTTSFKNSVPVAEQSLPAINNAALFEAMQADQQLAEPVTPAVNTSAEPIPAATVALFDAMQADLQLAAVTTRVSTRQTLFDAMRADLSVARPAEIPRVAKAAQTRPRRLPQFDLLATKTEELVAPESCECERDPQLGTALTWVNSLDAANALAERQGKLVFLIHVSGNFAIPGFT